MALLVRRLLAALALIMSLALTTTTPAQVDGEDSATGSNEPAAPQIPNLEELQAGRAAITDYIPTNFNFRVAVIGDFAKEFITESGPQKQIKTPLVLIDPSNGSVGVYAKNFPARIAAHSVNGQWVVGIAPSTAVEGSSGSLQKESAVSLDLNTGDIKLIREFSQFSKFQAVFDARDPNVIYYCVNEPASENTIVRYNLRRAEETLVPADGNRFYLYGLRTSNPQGLWVQDSSSPASHPVLSLLDTNKGEVLKRVEFPGSMQVLAQPGGETILASVSDSAEASLGYYEFGANSFHQVPKVVLTRPSFKWLNSRMAVLAKESTATRDRFLLIDLANGRVSEIFSAYFKISHWDVAPDDSALVFLTAAKDDPILYVIPLDNRNTAINRVQLKGVTNISWLACLYPGQQTDGSWLSRLLPFRF